ncbi:helix-turn-helix domain-containing protein [Salipaludibacillus daqingensis]|uniref:helix-turn-helix domain-containing protein n=1 Tax=Salipaludibacillus daqingensis TaxID=3041001 RepID=UPI0024732B9E|nr:helix-turn-helix transcriptional regulator [Salipaludibacillus daqingensis]
MLKTQLLKEMEQYIQDHLIVVEDDEAIYQSAERLEDRMQEEIEMVDLEDFIKTNRQPIFQQVLFRFIDEKGFTDPEVYKRAGLDRKHFSKIRSNEAYRPGKHTILALSLALELKEIQVAELLSSGGHSLSNSDTCDLIIQFCLERNIYDIDHVNHALEYFNEKPLSGGQ